MPTVPIRDFNDAITVIQMCYDTNKPIYATKEDIGDVVVMSRKEYERRMYMQDIYDGIAESEADFAAGRFQNAREALREVREELGV